MQRRDSEFLFEIGTLRFIQRTWKQFIGSNFENLAEHTLRVIWTALVIARGEDHADTAKIIKMALVHDITESRTGDVHYISRLYTKRNEKSAIQDMLKDTSLDEEFSAIWQEYEERKTIDAKIVKDADNIEVDLELMEQKARGNTLADKWLAMRRKVRSTLFTATAKKLFDEIYQADPDSWHINAPNRFSAGDWKD